VDYCIEVSRELIFQVVVADVAMDEAAAFMECQRQNWVSAVTQGVQDTDLMPLAQ